MNIPPNVGGNFIRQSVCVTTLDRNSSDHHIEVSVLGQILDVIGPHMSVVTFFGALKSLWSHSAANCLVAIGKI